MLLKKQAIMKEMWDERYRALTYAYGTEANVYFASSLEKYQVKGSILLAAEGEGRNAVFAAKFGLETHAFDISEEGKNKALQLAAKNEVSIDYQVGDFLSMDYELNSFDAAALIYAHFPRPLLSVYHQRIATLLKPGGLIILEGFSKNNLELRNANPKIGGPDKIEMLFSTESIQADFPNFEIFALKEEMVELQEGLYHNGLGKVIRFVGRKK